MNRPIKYRQWMGNKFHYWGFMENGMFLGPVSNTGEGGIRPSEQFTGLLDKNGKEIYEGDIVEIDVQLTSMAGIDTNRLAVEFSDGAFYPRPHGEVFEVIGNVWENPDLIHPTGE